MLLDLISMVSMTEVMDIIYNLKVGKQLFVSAAFFFFRFHFETQPQHNKHKGALDVIIIHKDPSSNPPCSLAWPGLDRYCMMKN